MGTSRSLSLCYLIACSVMLVFCAPALLRAESQTTKGASTAPLDDVTLQFFESKVRPVLMENCGNCHGPKRQMADVRVDSRQALLKGGENGPVVVPGEPQKSSLIQVIHYDGKIKMPPSGKLKPAEIEVLTQWVKMGAPWPAPRKSSGAAPNATTPAARRNFWSFQPVKRPSIPTVKNTPWVKSPLDAFILKPLEAKGLAPAPPADRRTLIRRATFDLTGLPPTLEAVRDFVIDQNPKAYEKLVDSLLASPAYGERWGRHWLDVARYADSLDARGSGSKGDIAEAWRYRDWVVDAFNRDLRYDEFIMQQVAGDILASSAKEYDSSKVVATGLLAIGNWGNGDADKEKVHTDMADDQVDIVSRGFMGLTVSCARCHDHKFDPISTRDYYAMAGMFFSTRIIPKFAVKSTGEDMLRIPLASPAELERREKYVTRVTETEAQLKTTTEAQYAAYAKEMLPETARYLMAVYDYHNRPTEQASVTIGEFAAKHGLHEYALRQWLSYTGLSDYKLLTTPIRNIADRPGVHGFKGPEDTPSLLANTTTENKVFPTFTLPPRSVSVHPSPINGVVVTWKSPIIGIIKIKGSVTDADSGGGDGITWAIDHRGGNGTRELAAGEIPNGGSQKFSDAKTIPTDSLNSITVTKGDVIELLVLPKGNYTFDTTVVDLVLEQTDGKSVWNLTSDIIDDLHQNGKGNPHSDRMGNAEVWRFSDMAGNQRRKITGPALTDNAASPLAKWQSTLGSTRDVVERAALEFQKTFTLTDKASPFWINNRDDERFLPATAREVLAKQVTALDTLKKDAPPPLEYANGAQEGGVPETPYAGFHDVRVHKRGSYARLGDVVPRGFPAVLAGDKQPRITSGSGRLELARWLASDKHPLTARVMVNRIWQHHFGAGIVRTPSNFGWLGERPSHPELLDYLAAEFVRSGWSIKKLHRTVMLSATYRQSSLTSARARQLDPDNHLLGRMNRRRLESEAIRDSLLTVAGKLDRKLGGPSVRDFKTPRRTLYITTIRSDRTGYGPLFDAADSTASVDRRTVSTVAPQALFMMNDPFAIQQSQELASRLLKESNTDQTRIAQAYLLLFGRSPSARETELGLKFLNSGLGAKDARTWEQYCQILLCSNEFIYVD